MRPAQAISHIVVIIRTAQTKHKDKASKKSGELGLVPTKNGKVRILALAPFVLQCFRLQKLRQNSMRMEAGSLWIERNPIFTSSVGDYLSYRGIYDCFKRIVKRIGCPNTRFHDMRHTYAVNLYRIRRRHQDRAGKHGTRDFRLYARCLRSCVRSAAPTQCRAHRTAYSVSFGRSETVFSQRVQIREKQGNRGCASKDRHI